MPLIIKIVFAVMLLSAVVILVLTATAADYDPRWDEDLQEDKNDHY